MSPFTTRPELSGHVGMVASTHWLASQSGMAVLDAGGNAFDAAVAAGLVLHVVEPHLNGPGGDLPVVAWSTAERRPLVFCGQGTAPAAATLDAFGALGLDLVPGTGLLPACVPGSFGAWLLMLRHVHHGLDLQAAIDAPPGTPRTSRRRSGRGSRSRAASTSSRASAAVRSRTCGNGATTSASRTPGAWAGSAP